MDNIQEHSQKEQKNQINTDEQFQIKIKSLLDTLAYKSAIYQLKSLGLHSDTDIVNRRRSIAGRLLRNHLQDMYKLFSQPNQLVQSIDLDVMIDLISYTITGYTQNNDECQALDVLLRGPIQQDFKYAFMVFRPKSLNFDIEKNHQESQIIRKIKFLTSLHMFIPKILSATNTLFEDFIDLLKQVMHLFHNYLNEDPQIMSEPIATQQDQRSSVYEAYLQFCSKILDHCATQAKQNNDIQSKPDKLYKLIENSISHLLLITGGSEPNEIYSEKQKHIKHQIYFVIKSQQNPLSLKNLKNYSQFFLIAIIKNDCFSSILQKKKLLYISSRILIKYSLQYTTGCKVGSSNEKMDHFLQQIVIFLCNVVLNKIEDPIKIEGQKIYISQDTWIDLIPIYKRMLVMLGFISPQHSKQCGELIKQVLKFDADRYKICPLPRIYIWSQLMKLAGNNEIDYRIFCISEYRKLLIQQKNQITKGNFQSHSYHTHSGIFVDAFEAIQNQMEILMLFGITNINCDYIGHVVSLMSNWLTCVKAYCNKYKNYHNKKLTKLKGELEKIAKKLQQKMSRHLQVIKQQNAVIQHQLILFRCRQLDFA